MARSALTAGFLIALFAAGAARAEAQVVDGRGIPYRQWDVTGSVGLHMDREPTVAYPDWSGEDNWDGGLLIQGEVGRYWNSHLKTELSAGFISPREVYSSELVEVPGGVASATARTTVRRQQVGAAVTYQFFDNVFAHPYVSVGVRATFHDQHKVRQPRAWIANRPSVVEVVIPQLETNELDILVRPVLAAGFKSYFNERSFLRSELSTAFNRGGLSQWSLRVGFGVDF